MAKKIVINKVIIIVLFIVLYINLLSTALLNGFWWDDIVYSLNYGSLRLIDKSVWQSIVDEIVAWIHRVEYSLSLLFREILSILLVRVKEK